MQQMNSGPLLSLLTSRELEVLERVVKGNNCREIGETLNISSRTVESYLDRIKGKLLVTNKRQLLNLIWDHGFAQCSLGTTKQGKASNAPLERPSSHIVY